jgi:thiol-disulfide isomerase/thioredoxin
MEAIQESVLNEKILSGKKIVLKVEMDDCTFCTQYQPIFEKVASQFPDIEFLRFNLPRVGGPDSTFKRKYMKPDANGSISAPATFVFEGGQEKIKHYGLIDEEQLIGLLSGVPVVDKKKIAHQELINLFATKGEILTFTEKLPAINARIEELQKFLSGK